MIKYFVNFVICRHDGRLAGKCDVVTAPEGTNQAEILKLLHAGNWPEAEYVRKFELWED